MYNPAEDGIKAARRDAYEARMGEIPMIRVNRDFRRGRTAEWLRGPRGNFLLVRTCAELVEARWEFFTSIEAEAIEGVGILPYGIKEGL